MTDKIKICFILSHLPQGGAERQTINLIRHLNSSRYDITLLIYSSKTLFYKEVESLPIRLITHQPNRNKLIRTLSNLLFLRKHLMTHHYDIIHTLLFHNGFSVRLVMPGKYNKKTVYSIRTTLSECPPLYRIFEKLFYGKSFVVTNSLKGMEEFKMIIGNRSTGNLTNIYNGFDIKRFTAENPPEVSGTLVFGTAGRQTAQKNQIQILRVLNRLKNTLSFHFYLIGEKYTGVTLELEKYISDNNLDRLITILDPISRIEEYYKKFNLFILSSKSEGCSNVLFEAMLSKCLCIVSKEANTDNFIKEGWNGLEYDGSDEDLERKINKAVQIINSGEVHKITHNGYAYASENFSMEKMVEGYEEIYRSLLADNAF